MISKKRKVLVSLASVAMLGGITLGSVGAFAADDDDLSTGVAVDFNEDDVPPIIDPDVLQLRAVPSYATFNTMTAGRNNQQVSARSVAGSGHVKLNDGRDDTDISGNREWSVSARASTLVSGSDEINDATISIATPGDALDWTPGATPTDRGTLGAPNASVTKQDLSLTTDGLTSEEFAHTTTGDKQGYAIPYGDMEMTVPNAPSSFGGKTFTGTITWSLSDTV